MSTICAGLNSNGDDCCRHTNENSIYCKKHINPTPDFSTKIYQTRISNIKYYLIKANIPKALINLIQQYDFIMNHNPIGKFATMKYNTFYLIFFS